MRQHHQRISALAQLGVPVEMQIGEERQAGRRHGVVRERGRVEHCQSDMPVAVSEFDLLEADGMRRFASGEAGRCGKQNSEEGGKKRMAQAEPRQGFSPSSDHNIFRR